MTEPATVCSMCGVIADASLLTWMRDVDQHGRPTWVCPSCTREHVRAVEAKLDRVWW